MGRCQFEIKKPKGVSLKGNPRDYNIVILEDFPVLHSKISEKNEMNFKTSDFDQLLGLGSMFYLSMLQFLAGESQRYAVSCFSRKACTNREL